MNPSRTSGAPVAYSSTTLGHIKGKDTWQYALDSDVCRPPSEGAGVGYGPIVVVTALWLN